MSPDRPAGRTEPRRGLVGRMIAERYRLTRMVSAGADSLIVDATDTELDRPVTVKLVRPEWAESADFRRRFAAAMRSAAPLSHPNLAAIYDWGEEVIGKRTTVYVVSEYLAGGSLRDLFDRGRQLSPSQALMVGLEACRGLDFAHRAGLVHGEVTPSKLVFGDDRRLRVVDFGLARVLGDRYWAEPATVPTDMARYCSPEQALGQPIDGKSDVYSLALVLVEAVTGVVPFSARSTVATLSARVGKLMPVSADLGSLAAVLERAGRPDPEDRSTAAQFGRGLVKAAEKLPRPAPIPILVSSLFEEDPALLRRPNDPTGGITRPSAEPPPSAAAPIAAPPPVVPPEAPPAPAEPAATESAPAAPEAPPAPAEPVATASARAVPEAPPAPAEPVATASAPAEQAPEAPAAAEAAPPPPASGAPAGGQLPPPAAAPTEPPGAVIPAEPEDVTAPIGAPTSSTTRPPPRLYDGDADLTKDELALLATAPAGEQVESGAEPPPVAGPPPVASERPRRRRWLTRLTAIVVVAALGALGYVAYILFRTPTHEVPDLVGLTEAEARAMTADFDWEIEVETERSDEEPDPGDIIRTAPEAGERLAEGEPFLLFVSEGPEFRPLPDLTGETLADAETALAQLDLTPLPPTEEHHEEIPAGSVISWSVPAQPALTAGDEVLPDTEVAIVVSSGPAPRTVPDLVNVPFAEARATLAELRLRVERLEPRFSTEIPKGSVMQQRPPAGREVERGSTVAVRVSKGPDLRRVPRLEGLTLPRARQALRQAGLRVGRLLGSTQGVVVDARVNGEPVVRGDRIPRGTPVDLNLF